MVIWFKRTHTQNSVLFLEQQPCSSRIIFQDVLGMAWIQVIKKIPKKTRITVRFWLVAVPKNMPQNIKKTWEQKVSS